MNSVIIKCFIDYEIMFWYPLQELNPILKIADSLRIRGLTTSTSVPAASDEVMMMTETNKDHHDEDEHQIIHASFTNSKPSKWDHFIGKLVCLITC